jgi:hypothetical protein
MPKRDLNPQSRVQLIKFYALDFAATWTGNNNYFSSFLVLYFYFYVLHQQLKDQLQTQHKMYIIIIIITNHLLRYGYFKLKCTIK